MKFYADLDKNNWELWMWTLKNGYIDTFNNFNLSDITKIYNEWKLFLTCILLQVCFTENVVLELLMIKMTDW